ARFITKSVTAFAYAIYRLSSALDSVEPDVARMKEILEAGKDPVTAEPLYILLSLAGHEDAHEEARVLARKARAAKAPLAQLIRTDPAVKDFYARMSPEQRAVLDDPARYL